MNVMTSRKPVAVGLAAAIAMGGMFMPGATGTVNAAPLSANALALKEAAPSDVVDVRRWRRYRGDAAVAGLALGIIGGVIAARQYDRHYRRHHRYHYAPEYHYGRYGYHGRRGYYGGYGRGYQPNYIYPTDSHLRGVN